jgi:glycosidase
MNEDGAAADDLKRAFTFMFSVRGSPLVYYGDEIGMRGGADPDNRHDFPGGWPGDPRNAFEASGRTAEENSIFDHVRRLAALRKQHPALRGGRMVDLLLTDHAYAFARIGGTDHAVVVIHQGPGAEMLRVPVAAAGFADGAELRAMGGQTARVSGGVLEVQAEPRSAEIYISQ